VVTSVPSVNIPMSSSRRARVAATARLLRDKSETQTQRRDDNIYMEPALEDLDWLMGRDSTSLVWRLRAPSPGRVLHHRGTGAPDHSRNRARRLGPAMTREHVAENRALLTVTAWRHNGELLGVVRWRPSLDDRTETVTSVRGFGELVALVARQLRTLSSDDD
jgi:hypothetical protein